MNKQNIIKGQRYINNAKTIVSTVVSVKKGTILYTMDSVDGRIKTGFLRSASEQDFKMMNNSRFYAKDYKKKKEEPKLVFRRTYKHHLTGTKLVFLGWVQKFNIAKFKVEGSNVKIAYTKNIAENFIQVSKRNSPGTKKGTVHKDEVYRYDKSAGGHIIRMGKQHDVVLTKCKTTPKTFIASLKIGEFEASKIIPNVFLREALEAIKLHGYPILLAEIGVLKSRREAGFESSSNDQKDGKTTVERVPSNGFSGTPEPKFPAGGAFEPVKPLTWTIESKNSYKKKSIWSKIKSFFGFGK